MGDISYSNGLILGLTVASFLVVAMGNKKSALGLDYWNIGFNNTDWATENGFFCRGESMASAQNIVVGGSEHWHFGFNYTDWAIKNGPLYVNDTLVFKYETPNGTTFPHSVYLLPNIWSFMACDLRRAKLVASPTQGGGEGFKFTLKKWQPHYFACGERNGLHCKAGLMKFSIMSLFRRCDI